MNAFLDWMADTLSTKTGRLGVIITITSIASIFYTGDYKTGIEGAVAGLALVFVREGIKKGKE